MFFPDRVVETLRRNLVATDEGLRVRDRVVAAARPWREMSDGALWALVFGPRITRSWMVWSDGYCPACKQGVPMYTWETDALNRPWKVRCPHCHELFPKNDFAAFHASGLDEHGLFDPARADRALLVNAEHAGDGDPLRGFGVDDGEGYAADGHRWRFIGAYLIYGQWKQAIVGGAGALATAYLATGEAVYARKAGILLDRIADVYPQFDFKAQGLVYERQGAAGYVSTWHDACEEHRELALAYDQVRPALAQDAELVRFLAAKAAAAGLANPKQSWADLQSNLEGRVLRDALTNRWKINSNYPRTDIALIITLAVLDPAGNRAEALRQTDAMLARATAVDGVTGEKGLANYSAGVVQTLAWFLELWDRAEPGFLDGRLGAVPSLRQTYRFFSDVRCLDRYHPHSGDSGHRGYAAPVPAYLGVVFQRVGEESSSAFFRELLPPSMYSFLWGLYEATGDAVYVQELHRANGGTPDGLPHDLFAADAEGVRRRVAEVIAREGPRPRLGSVNKTQWHLAILRSGEGPAARAVWLDYDAGGGHGHLDGLNLGLFAKGLDLLPEVGYPAVQFGGWGSPKARWSVMTASHNTVVVDGQDQKTGAGRTSLWFSGGTVRWVRATAPEVVPACSRFERTVALVDISAEDAYVLDVFGVTGGREHSRFTQCGFGSLELPGLTLEPAPDYGHGAQMRNCRRTRQPGTAWRAEWRLEDRHGVLPAGTAVGLGCIELTTEAEAWTAETWVAAEGTQTNREEWLPRLLVRRRAEAAPLASTFVAVLEPHDGVSRIRQARRLTVTPADGLAPGCEHVALEVALADGCRDVLVLADRTAGAPPESSGNIACSELGLQTDAAALWLRYSSAGHLEGLALAGGRRVAMQGIEVLLKGVTAGIELAFRGDRAEVVAGDRQELVGVQGR
jgi:hypothetical protein